MFEAGWFSQNSLMQRYKIELEKQIGVGVVIFFNMLRSLASLSQGNMEPSDDSCKVCNILSSLF